MKLKNTNISQTCIRIIATDANNTYTKIIGSHTLKDALRRYGEAEVLKVQEDIGLKVTILDEGYEGWRFEHGYEGVRETDPVLAE